MSGRGGGMLHACARKGRPVRALRGIIIGTSDTYTATEQYSAHCFAFAGIVGVGITQAVVLSLCHGGPEPEPAA